MESGKLKITPEYNAKIWHDWLLNARYVMIFTWPRACESWWGGPGFDPHSGRHAPYWLGRCKYDVTGWDRCHGLPTLPRVWQHVKLSDASLGTRPWYILVVDKDVKKPTNQTKQYRCLRICQIIWHWSISQAAPHNLPAYIQKFSLFNLNTQSFPVPTGNII